MRIIYPVALLLALTLSGCELTGPKRQEQQSQQPMKRELVIQRIDCPVPEAPLPDLPTGETCDAALMEDSKLNAIIAQLGARIEGLWDCINRHNKRAK